MLAPAWLPSPDSSVFPVVSSMDWYILLFSLYVACLVGIMILLLFVAKKHRNNIGITPAWRFRTQETASVLAWVRGLCSIDNIQTADRLQVSALAFGVLSLCSHLELIDSEVRLNYTALARENRLSAEQGFTPKTVLFVATLFGHMTMLCDIMLLLFDRRRPKYWCFAATIILTLDGTSIAVVAAKEVIEWNEIGQNRICADDTHRGRHWCPRSYHQS